MSDSRNPTPGMQFGCGHRYLITDDCPVCRLRAIESSFERSLKHLRETIAVANECYDEQERPRPSWLDEAGWFLLLHEPDLATADTDEQPDMECHF